MFESILVGTDGSDTAAVAVARGIELARAIAAHVPSAHRVQSTPLMAAAPEAILGRCGDDVFDGPALLRRLGGHTRLAAEVVALHLWMQQGQLAREF